MNGPDPDLRFMGRALELAERGWGRVAPNPLVGAVVVRDGTVVGEGHHDEFGGAHAEEVALGAAGEGARGATLYVTLEPCDHHGKTPPCTEAILGAGVARVVFASPDPDPASGGGAGRLRAAGLDVRAGVRATEARRLNAAFFWTRVSPSRGPFPALKLACSLDGRLAERRGTRTAVTGREARKEVHRLRAGFDAILIGRATAEVDDPLLTVRDAPSPRRPPTRVVLDSDLRLPLQSRLTESVDAAPLWIVARRGADPERRERLEAGGARVLEAARGSGGEGLDPADVLLLLRREGLRSVLVEGGGRVAASFLRAESLQRLYLFYAPVLFGPEGVPAFPDVPSRGLDSWHVVERRALGRDTLLVLEAASLEAALAGAAEPRRAEAAGGTG